MCTRVYPHHCHLAPRINASLVPPPTPSQRGRRKSSSPVHEVHASPGIWHWTSFRPLLYKEPWARASHQKWRDSLPSMRASHNGVQALPMVTAPPNSHLRAMRRKGHREPVPSTPKPWRETILTKPSSKSSTATATDVPATTAICGPLRTAPQPHRQDL